MGLGSIIGDIISPLTGGGKGGVLGGGKGGSNSILKLLTGLIGGGTGGSFGAGSTILPAALSMLFSGSNNSDPVPAPMSPADVLSAMNNPSKHGGQAAAGQPQSSSMPAPSQFGADFTPTASPKMAHAMAWYPGDPNAPPDGAMPGMKKPTVNPYDFNSYFGGMQ